MVVVNFDGAGDEAEGKPASSEIKRLGQVWPPVGVPSVCSRKPTQRGGKRSYARPGGSCGV